MIKSIQIEINGQPINYDPKITTSLTVTEMDFIGIQVCIDESDDPPEIYFEDYIAPIVFKNQGGLICCEVVKNPYFRECFGYSVLRIVSVESVEIITFDVQAKKTTATQAIKMIEYLSEHGENIVNSCFSRSVLSVGAVKNNDVEPEMFLSTAENFLEILQSNKLEFLKNIRKRLHPLKQPLWKTNSSNCEIDPYDVINNLDALTPSASLGDVLLRGRYFDLNEIHVLTMQPTSNVIENQILLGGLYSINININKLLKKLKLFSESPDNNSEYESFSFFMLKITSTGMINRSINILNICENFIRLFENRLKIVFQGEITPAITPYVRNTRIYRKLFTSLTDWYELGKPEISGNNFLMKLKSLSKIYEMFTLFHIVERLILDGWNIEAALPHEFHGEAVPSFVLFTKGDDVIQLQYEPRVYPFSSKTEHMDLVDLHHSPNKEYSYWSPDFVVRIESGGQVRYLILDAKYSTLASTKKYHIPDLFEKYYVQMGVYDNAKKMITNTQLLGIFAVYSIDEASSRSVSKWYRHGIDRQIPRIPMVSAIGLMTNNSIIFNESLSKIIQICKATLNQ